MGRKRRYTERTLRKGVESYVRAITRTVSVTEEIDTGKRDRYGHVIYERQPVHNDDGEEVKAMEFLTPPTVGGLCRHLGISRSTWERYRDAEEHPELQEITERAGDLIRGYLEEELLTRPGRNTRGVIFALQAQFGQRARVDVKNEGSGALRVIWDNGTDGFD